VISNPPTIDPSAAGSVCRSVRPSRDRKDACSLYALWQSCGGNWAAGVLFRGVLPIDGCPEACERMIGTRVPVRLEGGLTQENLPHVPDRQPADWIGSAAKKKSRLQGHKRKAKSSPGRAPNEEGRMRKKRGNERGRQPNQLPPPRQAEANPGSGAGSRTTDLLSRRKAQEGQSRGGPSPRCG